MPDNIRDRRVSTLDPQYVKRTTNKPRPDELDAADEADDAGGAGDVSPHFGGRAQPGDVLGFETGGETTSLGDTSEDENKRRHDADKEVAEDIKKRRDELTATLASVKCRSRVAANEPAFALELARSAVALTEADARFAPQGQAPSALRDGESLFVNGSTSTKWGCSRTFADGPATALHVSLMRSDPGFRGFGW